MPSPMNSPSSEQIVQPRLFTPPLVELTPETSYGFGVIRFAEICGQPLDPWQQWVVIHAGELRPDGSPRFKTVLILVGRQNGKTHLAKMLAAYWMMIEKHPMIFGTSTKLPMARESWRATRILIENNKFLAKKLKNIRSTNGQEELESVYDTRYMIGASDSKGGRGMTINRLVLDELREHKTFEAWEASSNATNAISDAQIYCLSNQGGDEAIVLDSLRDPALRYIETGQGDARLGLFEYSAEDNAAPDNLQALYQANPGLYHRGDVDALLGRARRAIAAGGEQLAQFRTEVMCQRVRLMDPAIDPDLWTACGVTTEDAMQLNEYRNKLALCADVSIDGSSASLVGAAVIDGITHVEVIKHWDGFDSTARMKAELPDLLKMVKPAIFGWFPTGPAASVAVELRERRAGGGQTRFPPAGTKADEIKGDAMAACMEFAELVRSHSLRHGRQAILDLHVAAAQKLPRGDGWVFTRRGMIPVDATYAAAGAAHLARGLRERPKLVTVST